MAEKILIIDGNAIIHRSFHALPTTLATKDGIITNAAYGFASFLIKALGEIKPSHVVLTLDRKAETFRHKVYKKYKATRAKAPQELYDQIPMVKDIATAFSIPIFELDGFEADDLIGTIAKKINVDFPKMEVIIMTGDLDTLQLVNKKTKVYTMSRGLSEAILYDDEKILERFSLKTEQLIDFKALKGDASDNIPGVPGIGEKTAVELLHNFDNLDNIYKNINNEKIKKRTRELLMANKDLAYLSQELGTINLAAPIDFSLTKAKIKGLNKNLINSTFSKLEFKSLLSRVLALNFIKGDEGSAIDKFARNKEKFNYNLVKSEADFKKLINKLKKQKEIALDTETTSLDIFSAKLLGISFSFTADEAYFVDLKDEDPQKLQALKEVISDPQILKIAHNIKYDWQVLQNYNIEIAGPIFDTMVASYLLNPESRQHNLDALAFSELNWEKINANDLIPEKEKDFSQVDLEKLAIYSCEDVDFTLKLKNILLKKLKKNKLERLFNEVEIPLIRTLIEMERNGVLLDLTFLKKLSQQLEKEIKSISEQIWYLAGEEFNINSTKQLREILFEKMEIKAIGLKKTKTGISTAAEELEKIKEAHPIISLIQDYRELSKLSSTYVDALPQLVNKKSGRIHTNFNQTITATGRLSSSDPNLQNIPTKTELGNKIRQAFIAPPRKKILSLDYSQIELRVMAHLSKDKHLLDAFAQGLDIHSATAARIFSKNPNEIDKKTRNQAKAINFGIIYGQGPHGLSQNTGLSYSEAREFIKKYFIQYQGVKKYIDKTIKFAEENGYTETMFGRKRPLLEINSSEVMKKKAAERMAINSPIQGSAADLLKLAMIKIYEEIKDSSDIKMLIQVHDELIFEVNKEKVDFYQKKIKNIMENIVKLDIPLVVEAYSGDNWGEMEKIDQ